MKELDPIRISAEKMMHDLIHGLADPDSASRWAQEVYSKADNRTIIEQSPSLTHLFDGLVMSSFRHGRNMPLMWDIEFYNEWYKEYKKEYEEE